MTFEELLKSIYKERSQYKKMVAKKGRRFLLSFLETLPDNNFETWCNISLSKLAALTLVTNGYKEKIDLELLGILDYLDVDGIETIRCFKDTSHEGKEDYAEILYRNAAMNSSALVSINTMKTTTCTVGAVRTYMPYYEDDFKKFVNMIIDYGNYLDTFLMFNIAKLESYYKTLINRYDNAIKTSIIKRTLLEEFPFTKEIEKRMQKIYDYAKEETRGLTSKEITKTMNAYNSIIEKIQIYHEQEEIKDIDSLLSPYISNNLKNNILTYVYEHNLEYYNKLTKIYEDKKSNSILDYIVYFKSIGLDFVKLNNIFKHEIMKDSIDTIKEKIKYISRYVYTENYFKVLISNSIEDLTIFNNYVKKEYLTNDFIKENVDMLIDSNIKNNIISNIEICQNNKINLKKYNDKTFLLVDSSLLKENIMLLNKLNIPYEKCNDLSMLKETLGMKLDLFIEVGLYEYIISNPDLLNIDIDLAKRIVIAKDANIDYMENGTIKDIILYKHLFCIPSDLVSEYVLDRTHIDYNNSDTVFIPGGISNYSYNVNGVIIPSSRVRENPVKLEDIIRPSLYSEEEINTLEKLR